MAIGPDPNRNFETDRENTPEELLDEGGLGNPRSTRMGLSSGVIAGIAVLIAVGVIALLL